MNPWLWAAVDHAEGRFASHPSLDWDPMPAKYNTNPPKLKAEYRDLADRYNRDQRWAWANDPNQEIPVVEVRGDEMGGAAEGHKTARNWARTNLANPEGWVNEATGWRVRVQTSGIDEAIHRLRWPHGLARQTLAAIPDLLRVAVPVQTEPDREGRPDIRQVHTLIAPLELAGCIYRARMVIREMNGTGTTYYGHHLEGLDIKMPGAGGVGRETCSLDFTQTPDTLKVGHLLTGFNPHEDNQD